MNTTDAKVYKIEETETSVSTKWLTDSGEVLALWEPIPGGMTVPTAMVLVPQKSDVWPLLVLFCAARKSGSYQWLSEADGGKAFKSRAEALEYAKAWAAKVAL